MRRAICFAFISLVLLLSPVAMAGPVYADAKPVATIPVLRTDSTVAKPDAVPAVPAVQQLTQFRWATHTDATTGASSLRLVFDVSGPVDVDGSLSSTPTPRLMVTVKGAQPGKVSDSANLDGKIADSVSIYAVDGQNTKIAVDLPLMVDEGDYRVFTLPPDASAGKPFRVVVDINKPLPPVVFNFTSGLKGKVITIDPGHGGSDPGAIGLARIQEKTVTLAVSLKVKALLEKAGAKVLMTRDTDIDVFGPNSSAVDELKARTTVANARKADIFLSIHANSFVNRTVGGTATYYYQKSQYDSLLAQCIQAGVVQTAGLSNRGSFPANFYVIKRTLMPASLLEMGFLSNPDEEKLLNDPVFQQKVAQGIVQGMDRFFTLAAQGGGDR
ncbi:MAG: N-acetylmuramoyl-L-alanine amidase [Negativicutes bacterium]|nr:N-acetylmuramoyl-L-alanine amidase [Negativicutes bacterium]